MPTIKFKSNLFEFIRILLLGTFEYWSGPHEVRTSKVCGPRGCRLATLEAASRLASLANHFPQFTRVWIRRPRVIFKFWIFQIPMIKITWAKWSRIGLALASPSDIVGFQWNHFIRLQIYKQLINNDDNWPDVFTLNQSATSLSTSP